MPERAPLKGRGVHTAFVGAGLAVAGVLVSGLAVGLLGTAGGPVAGGGMGQSVDATPAVPAPTFGDVEPTGGDEAPAPTEYPAPTATTGTLFYEDYVLIEPSWALDLDQVPPEAGGLEDVGVEPDGDDMYVIGRSEQMLVKGLPGPVPLSLDVCAELLTDADPMTHAVPVSPDDTVCLTTDEGHIASLLIVNVYPGQGVDAEVTVWTPEVPLTE